MGNWAEETFAPIEAVYAERVAQDTWGHLAPKKNVTYKGQILVSKKVQPLHLIRWQCMDRTQRTQSSHNSST